MIQIYVNSAIQKKVQNIFYYFVENTVKLENQKRKIKESALIDWTSIWQASKAKGKQYSQFECKPK